MCAVGDERLGRGREHPREQLLGIGDTKSIVVRIWHALDKSSNRWQILHMCFVEDAQQRVTLCSNDL